MINKLILQIIDEIAIVKLLSKDQNHICKQSMSILTKIILVIQQTP